MTLQHVRDRGVAKGFEVVEVKTVSGTALPGVDYAPVDQRFAFQPRDPRKTVTIPVFADDQNTDSRTFSVRLNDVGPSGGPSAPVARNGGHTIAALSRSFPPE